MRPERSGPREFGSRRYFLPGLLCHHSATNGVRAMTIRLMCAAAAVFAAIGYAMGGAQAQGYPDKPIHIISGTQVGTSGDLAGRMLAQKLTAQLGQPVVFESRPGANGQIAANYLKTLPPDGANILYTASSTVVTGPLMSKSVGFDTFKDFTPISQAVGAPLYLVVNSELGIDTTAGLVDYAKKNPGKLNYGSVGRGSVFHFQGEAMNTAARISIVHVPYAASSMPNIIGDLLANRLQVFFPAYSTIVGVLPLGKIKLLGVFADQTLAQRPELATVQETIPGLTTVPSWFGLFSPAGLKPSVVGRLETE